MHAITITTCSNRKFLLPREKLRAQNLPTGTIKATAERWCKRTKQAKEKVRPDELYCGRAYREADLAAESLSSGLWVISAGLGLISPTSRVPAYDLTLTTASNDCIFKKIKEPATPSDWWEAIARQKHIKHPLSKLVQSQPRKLVLIAGSGPYTNLVANDLLNLESKDLRRVRIFGPQKISRLPKSIQNIVMPYDARFDGKKSPIPGTRTDFPQRVMRHFAEEIMPTTRSNASPETHSSLVLETLSAWKPARNIKRIKKTDDEIIELVVDLWDRAQGSSTKMLRVLRDKEKIACEQGRFASLFKVAKERYSL